MGDEIQKWADSAMYAAEPIDESGPKVYLLDMSRDPLGSIAAACKMYKGEVARGLDGIADSERQDYLAQVMRTKLQAPFEFVHFHFLFEGVSRAFTHQLVRQRTAAYAQESLRFAVKEDMPQYLPPSLAGTMSEGEWEEHWGVQAVSLGLSDGELHDYAISHSTKEQIMRLEWDEHNRVTKQTYNNLINMGMPAEDARGRLPHDTLTRVHYTTNLRALLDHAGNRLCTQAQFEWRHVWALIIESIREYQPHKPSRYGTNAYYSHAAHFARGDANEADEWQFRALADLFKPVCYLTGKCEFKANFDRPCSIRDRVDLNESEGRGSENWGQDYDNGRVFIPEIKPAEWLLNPNAAR